MTHFGRVELERRVFPRFKLEIPVSYVVENEPPRTGVTANASRGGLLLYLPEKLDSGLRLRIKMFLSDRKAPRMIEVVAKVVWINEQPEPADKGFKAGVAFEQIAPADLEYFLQFERLWLEQAH